MDIEIAGLGEFAFAATPVCRRQRDALLAGLAASVSKGRIISAVMLAMTVAGCAHNQPLRESNLARREARADAVRAVPPAKTYSERPAQPRVRRVAVALLSPQPVPDCEFREPDSKTVDGDEFRRLKLEYERQCYKDAEQAVRKRLKLLQASNNRCEMAPVARRPAVQDALGRTPDLPQNKPH
jgi:hypothetical protein